jgi:hypothetical protein
MPCTEKRFNNECPICTEEFDSDEKVIVALCGHRYHPGCFDEVVDHSTTCVYRCGVLDRICLERFKPVSEKIKLTIHMGKSKDVPIVTKLTASGESLHTTVRALTGADEGSFYLERAGTVKVIQDNADHLSFYGVEDGDTINFLMRGFGGGKRGSASASGAAVSGKKLRNTKGDKLKDLEELAGNLLLRLQARHDVAPPVIRRLIPQCLARCAELRLQMTPLDQMLTIITKKKAETLSTELYGHNNVDDRFLQVTATCFEAVFDEMREIELQFVKTRELCNGLVTYALMKQYGDANGTMSWTRLSTAMNKKVQNDVVRELQNAHAAHGVAPPRAVPAEDAMEH